MATKHNKTGFQTGLFQNFGDRWVDTWAAPRISCRVRGQPEGSCKGSASWTLHPIFVSYGPDGFPFGDPMASLSGTKWLPSAKMTTDDMSVNFIGQSCMSAQQCAGKTFHITKQLKLGNGTLTRSLDWLLMVHNDNTEFLQH